jgi:hypothetical protein
LVLSNGSVRHLLQQCGCGGTPGPDRGRRRRNSSDALTGILDWTWGRLNLQQQTLLARLSVFSSGWTDELATAVVGTSAVSEEDLDELIDMCLVVRSDTAQGARFEIVAAAREHAALRLAQAL